jgi:hypothetical protein
MSTEFGSRIETKDANSLRAAQDSILAESAEKSETTYVLQFLGGRSGRVISVKTLIQQERPETYTAHFAT